MNSALFCFVFATAACAHYKHLCLIKLYFLISSCGCVSVNAFNAYFWHPSSHCRQSVSFRPSALQALHKIRCFHSELKYQWMLWGAGVVAHFSTRWKQHNRPALKALCAFHFAWRLKLQEASLQDTECAYLAPFTAHRPTWRGVKLYFQILPTLDCLLVVWRGFMARGLRLSVRRFLFLTTSQALLSPKELHLN